MGKIYLARHPQTIENCNSIIADPLKGKISQRGYWQAKKLAQRLKQENIDTIFSSDSQRCEILANIIKKYNPNLKINYSHILREKNPGNLIGMDKNILEELSIEEKPINGESILDTRKRAVEFLSRGIAKNSLILSHGFFLKILLGTMIGLSIENTLKSIKFSNCALTIVNNKNSEYMVDMLNSKEHFGTLINKIHIFGPYGSGKTTMARDLSEKFDIKYFSLDDIKYENKFDKIRPLETRLKLLDKITSDNEWITEGSWSNYADYAFERADLLLYYNPGLFNCIIRSSNRQFQRWVGNKNFQGDGASNYISLISEIFRYFRSNMAVSQNTHLDYVDNYRHKVKIIKSNQDLSNICSMDFLEDILL